MLAEQLAFVPPPEPLQDHDHGPEPDTAEAAPALHSEPPEGAEDTVVPFAAPHAPFTGAAGFALEQLAFVPPPEPVQFHR